MTFTEIGYHAALTQLGLTKEANIFGRAGKFITNLFGKKPYMPQGASAQTSGMLDDAFAGIKAKPKDIAMPARKEMGSIEEAFVKRKTPAAVSPQAEIKLPKNTARPDPVVRPAKTAPAEPAPAAAPAAATPPAAAAAPPAAAPAAAAPAAAPAAAADAASPAAQTGMLAFMRRNPLASVGMAGAGAGGLGYVAGMGSPPPGQPMQQYGQGPMGYQ